MKKNSMKGFLVKLCAFLLKILDVCGSENTNRYFIPGRIKIEKLTDP
jgi:hypothetical protein